VTVWASIKVEGFHCWPGAIPAVAFLADSHRHLFGVRVEMPVTHTDRDREFILLGREVKRYLLSRFGTGDGGAEPCEFGARSCEAIAKELLDHFGAVSVEVDEDGENGARVRRCDRT
jgi:hypothetical protein